MWHRLPALLLISQLLIGCNSSESLKQEEQDLNQVFEHSAEAVSLLGKELFPLDFSKDQQAKLDSNLAIALSNYENFPNEENIIWYGRRLAYLMRYGEAIEVYTDGLEKFPDSYKLLRHRGHRYISTRQFSKAIGDLKRASESINGKEDETEPDGIPNKLNQPLSSVHFNIWYHLGLVYYLTGDFENAAKSYRECMKVSKKQ